MIPPDFGHAASRDRGDSDKEKAKSQGNRDGPIAARAAKPHRQRWSPCLGNHGASPSPLAKARTVSLIIKVNFYLCRIS